MVFADWGDVVSVYHRPSGETHALNDVTAAFLRALREGGPGSVAVVVERAAELAGADEEQMAAKDFLEVVARLDELGLIRCTRAGARPA